jgi:PAS domain S-box-containing protein
LCLPIARQARLLGILYLENRLVTGAFTAGRLSVLELLASQSAISLENALLYSELEQKNAERRRAAQTLRASQETLQAIIDNSAAAIYLKDSEGRFLLANRHVGNLLCVPSEQLLGKTDADFFPAPVAQTVREHDRKVLAAGIPMEWEEEMPLADGLHTFLSVKFPLGRGPAPRSLCGISTDITERKEAERRIAFQAFHDPLTELGNRSLLTRDLTAEIDRTRHEDGVGSRSCAWTWTTSRTSTTRSATPSVISSSRSWRSASAPPSGRRTGSPATAATSSSS